MALNDLYQQRILEHNRRPQNRRRLGRATHVAEGFDALCGDALRIELEVDDAGRILDAAWSGEACAVTTASASMLTAWLGGRSVDEVARCAGLFERLLADPELDDVDELNEINSLRAVSSYPSRVRNAWLPWRTTLDALGLAAQSAPAGESRSS